MNMEMKIGLPPQYITTLILIAIGGSAIRSGWNSHNLQVPSDPMEYHH